jgi:hypothetical protein
MFSLGDFGPILKREIEYTEIVAWRNLILANDVYAGMSITST